MKSLLPIGMFFSISILLMACQSQPAKQIKPVTQPTQKTVPLVTTQVTTRQVPVVKSKDGVQDIRWALTQVKFKQAQFFNEMPYFTLNSTTKRVQAHTGCNPTFGTYQLDVNHKTLKFEVNAGHMMCDNALAQEADLMDAFARARYFQINGRTMQIFDQNRQILMQAEQR